MRKKAGTRGFTLTTVGVLLLPYEFELASGFRKPGNESDGLSLRLGGPFFGSLLVFQQRADLPRRSGTVVQHPL